jgi:ubiquinone/menaquinone biosynthesis C-methylase UbiE
VHRDVAGEGDSADGLAATDFVRVAENGFGDGLNAYAHSMAWFNDALFVGTTRATFCMVHFNDPGVMRVWPTQCPADIDTLDRRARIWRYEPRRLHWQEVVVSPTVSGHQGRRVARDIGYRGMAVHHAAGADAPSLFVCGWASSRSERPPVILETKDGTHFRVLPNPGLTRRHNTFRTLVSHRSRLFTSPTGATRGWKNGAFKGSTSNAAGTAMVLESSDPARGLWRTANQPGFGDPSNTTVFEMMPFSGHLYAGTLNPTEGLQIWKARADGRHPYVWKKVLAHGASRHALNECATSMCVFNGALYVGTGIQNGGYDKKHKVGPAAAELLRIHPDDTWDLVVGRSRSTPAGFKTALSGYGPGFDDYYNAYFWRMAAHDGWLYVGTYKWGVLLPFLPIDKWPAAAAAEVRRIGVDRLAEEEGGFDLWRSRDGVQWEPVTCDGFGNPYNYGVRTMASTPYGLFVGTANPFGPKVARRGRNRWHYETNPRGGLEIWQASGRHRRGGRTARTYPYLFRTAADLPAASLGETNRVYDRWMYAPVSEEMYGSSDFFNFGYWSAGTSSPQAASEHLMRRLLAFVPTKRGTILDVACGKGATTRYLLNFYPPSRITGINISDKQLKRCRENAPGVRFLTMDATRLTFPDRSFDQVVCVEAAFHFDTREQFLREAYRVLKPGGYLVLSDILMHAGVEHTTPLLHGANYVANLADYRALYGRCGFSSVHVEDTTDRCWRSYSRYADQFLRQGLVAGTIGWWSYAREMRAMAWMDHSIAHYVLVVARKPERS